MSPPFMPLYIGDYHADTTHLSRDEHGAYLLLLMAMWRAGGRLPSDDGRLGLLAKATTDEWADMRTTILGFFKRRGGHLTHKRITSELARYDNKIEQKKRAGKASAAKRANENNEMPVITLERNSTNQNQNQNQNHKEKQEVLGDEAKAAPVVEIPIVPTKRCPPDWQPDPETVVKLTVLGHMPAKLEYELQLMKDHTFSTPRDDWNATFSYWIKTGWKRNGSNGRQQSPGLAKLEAIDGAMVEAVRLRLVRGGGG